jgi:hypothetical protein
VPGCGSVRENHQFIYARVLQRRNERKKTNETDLVPPFYGLLISAAMYGVVLYGLYVAFGLYDSVPWKILISILFFSFAYAQFTNFWGIAPYLLTVAYNFSIKSTAIVWLPLLYISKATYDDNYLLMTRIEDIRISSLWKLIRGISWIILAIFVFKVVVLPQIINWWNSLPGIQVAAYASVSGDTIGCGGVCEGMIEQRANISRSG